MERERESDTGTKPKGRMDLEDGETRLVTIRISGTIHHTTLGTSLLVLVASNGIFFILKIFIYLAGGSFFSGVLQKQLSFIC